MTGDRDRRLGFLFALLGAGLLILSGLLDLAGGAVALAVGHADRALGFVDPAVLAIGVGVIIGLFAIVGRDRGSDRSVGAGVILLVLVLVGWLLLGFAGGVLTLLASICVLVGALLFLLAGR